MDVKNENTKNNIEIATDVVTRKCRNLRYTPSTYPRHIEDRRLCFYYLTKMVFEKLPKYNLFKLHTDCEF